MSHPGPACVKTFAVSEIKLPRPRRAPITGNAGDRRHAAVAGDPSQSTICHFACANRCVSDQETADYVPPKHLVRRNLSRKPLFLY
eukprot:23305-Rhodomonas_salina.1